jgi:uncharacterized coiled-coil protein SlyX
VAEPTEHRLEALRKLLGDETVVIVVPKSALEAGLRSDLLPSRGHGDDGGSEDGHDAPDPAAEDTSQDRAEDAPPQLRAVEPLPEQDAGDGDSSVDSVVALAAQARGLADMLAEQAASIRTEAARADSAAAEKLAEYETQIEALESQIAELEARVQGLESELASRQEAMDGTADRLEEMLQLLRAPEPVEAVS